MSPGGRPVLDPAGTYLDFNRPVNRHSNRPEQVLVHVCGLLGYTPNRGSLHRVLQKLKVRGELAVEFPGWGTRPTRYRKGVTGEAGSGS